MAERPISWEVDPNRRFEYSEIEVEIDGVPCRVFALCDNMDPDNDLGFVTRQAVAELVARALNDCN